MKYFDGIEAKLLAQPGKGFEENEGVPSWNIVGWVTRAAIAICVNPRLGTRAKPAHPLFGAFAGSRKLKPMANLDSIVDVIVRPPFVGTLDHADTVIDDFYAIG